MRRFLDRSVRVLFTPNDNEIVEEIERSIETAGGKVNAFPALSRSVSSLSRSRKIGSPL